MTIKIRWTYRTDLPNGHYNYNHWTSDRQFTNIEDAKKYVLDHFAVNLEREKLSCHIYKHDEGSDYSGVWTRTGSDKRWIHGRLCGDQTEDL